MQGSDKVHKLIQSLSKNEKRFFKMYCYLHNNVEDKNYIKLFDAIDKQKEYSEQILKKKFRGTKIEKQFAVLKKYLYDSILDALVYYHRKKKVDSEVNYIYKKAQILHNKSMSQEASILLQKAKEKAEKYECFYELLKVFSLEVSLTHAFHKDAIYLIGKCQEIQEQKNIVMEKIKNRDMFLMFYYATYNIIFNQDLNTRISSQKEIAKLLEVHPVFKQKAVPNSTSARTHYYAGMMLCMMEQKDYEAFLKYSLLHLDLIKGNRHMFSEKNLLASIYNTVAACTDLRDMELFEDTISQLKNYKSKNKELTFISKYYYYMRTLEAAISFEQPQIGIEIKSDLLEDLTKNARYFSQSQKEYLCFYLARCCFVLGEYEEAQNVLELLDGQKIQHTILFYFPVRLIKAICYIEQKKLRLAVRELRSVKSKLNREGMLLKIHDDIVKVLTKLTTSKIDLYETFRSFEGVLQTIEPHVYEKVLGNDFLDKWVTQKLSALKAPKEKQLARL